MKSYRLVFRALILGELLTLAMALACSFFFSLFLTEDEQIIFEWAGHGGVFDQIYYAIPESAEGLYFFALFVFAAGVSAWWLLALVGLFFFQWWSRWLYFALQVFGIFMIPLSGFTILLASETFFYTLNAYCVVGILCFAFFSPLRKCFRSSLHTKTPPNHGEHS